MEKRVPYNTGKVKIGVAYQPRQHYPISATESRLQQALLGDQPSLEDRAERLFLRCLYIIGAVALTIIWFTR